MQKEDEQVLTSIIDVMSAALNELVGSCMDNQGNPKAPDKRELMKARAMLPAQYQHALSKKVNHGNRT